MIADINRAIRYGVRGASRAESDIEIVGEAGDSNVALCLVAELRPDVLILDTSMPAPGGMEVIRLVARAFPDVRMIVHSLAAHSQADALSAGADTFVSKAAPEEELLRAVRRVAGGPKCRNAALPEQRLGEHLLARRLITAAQLDAALAWQRSRLRRGCQARLGGLLVELGALSAADLQLQIRLRRSAIHPPNVLGEGVT